MKTPTKIGQKYTAYGNEYTVVAFHGSSGEFFDTPEEVRSANPEDRFVCVWNEFGGSTQLDHCELIEQ